MPLPVLLRGARGPDIGTLHQMLVETGLIVDSDELTTQAFGSSTEAAVRDFQARHVDADGRALVQDGVVGPKTWAAIDGGSQPAKWSAPGWHADLSSVSEPAHRVLEIAIGEIGVREQPPGSNRGPRIDVYTNWVGVPPEKQGPPWCASYVCWAWTHAEGGSPMGRLQSVYKITEWARTPPAHLVDSAGLEIGIRPGDVFCILRTRFHGHCGLVVEPIGDGQVSTVEGNSSGAVRGLVREVATFTHLVRVVA